MSLAQALIGTNQLRVTFYYEQEYMASHSLRTIRQRASYGDTRRIVVLPALRIPTSSLVETLQAGGFYFRRRAVNRIRADNLSTRFFFGRGESIVDTERDKTEFDTFILRRTWMRELLREADGVRAWLKFTDPVLVPS